MMKVFESVGRLVLLTSVIASCYGQNPVTVLCSIEWFMVTVQPYMLNSGVYVHFSELYLGQGCPASHVEPHLYQFIYRVTECGIRVKAVSGDMIMYSSEMHYASKGTSARYVVPVSCMAPQSSPWLTKPCHVSRASGYGTPAKDDKTSYNVFELSPFNERPACDCPPCVCGEEEGALAVHAETPSVPEQSPYFVTDLSEAWSLHSDDLIGSM
ncbi:placenta-specific protein 1 [Echinops telfairi]|uniref:Placenta-specific protein 1 n=2 Tax=Echinops telfairi TaxID=9371 RepID=A0ABM0J5R8_ECHTE|nr:placenta-specific protein 1 [Echinops telfairi]XP_045144311.1 placenta-specific protein 1 [Echinops telfairi]